MSRISPSSWLTHLLAVTAGLLFAGSVMTAPALATTHHGTGAHAAKLAHHAASARHSADSTSKTASKSSAKASATHKTSAAAKKKKAVRVTKPAPQPSSPPAAPAPVTVAAPLNCTNTDLIPTSANLDLVRAATLCLINQQRLLAGLSPLIENPALDAAAQDHSNDMVANDYFDHVTPSGLSVLSRVVAAGFATLDAVLDLGENIAAGGGSLATPAATVANWMGSPPHRANILDPTFKDTGVGVAPAVPAMLGIGTSGATYTQTFGTAQ
jgi:uncharacterized protein YkwD